MNDMTGAAAGPTIAGRDQALETAGAASGYTTALAYAARRGLTVPMRSSVVRGFLHLGEKAGTVATLLVTIGEESEALHTEVSAMANGECH